MALSPSDIIASNDYALAKKDFLRKTNETFQAKPGLWDMVEKQIMTGKKTDSDLVLGPSGDATTHEPGTDLTGDNLDEMVREISLEDKETVKNFHRTKVEDLIDHTDTRSKLGEQAGKALRQTCEKQAFANLITGARKVASGDFPGGNKEVVPGATISEAFPKTLAGSEALQEVLSLWQTSMAEKHVDMEDDNFFVWLSPYLNSVLLKDKTLQNRDYTDVSIGNLVDRKITKVEKTWVMESTLIPTTDMSAATAPTVKGNVVYNVDASLTAFVGCKVGAIGARHTPMDVWFDWVAHQRQWNIGAGFIKGLASRRPEYSCECQIDGV